MDRDENCLHLYPICANCSEMPTLLSLYAQFDRKTVKLPPTLEERSDEHNCVLTVKLLLFSRTMSKLSPGERSSPPP